MSKLYIVVDSELPAGLKMAQAVHAAYLYANKYPDDASAWYTNSNNLVILESPYVADVALWLRDDDLKVVYFREPDLQDRITALCVEPRAKSVLSKLPLAS